MPVLDLPLIEAHRPSTFLERGVAVPFITPVLTCARVRQRNNRASEFLLPNPAGGRGVYVLGWPGVLALCRPTVHDTLLQERICELPACTPASIRASARAVAAEGYAGREARHAAAVAAANEQQAVQRTTRELLRRLTAQCLTDLPAATSTSPPANDTDGAGRPLVVQIASRLGCQSADLRRAITMLGLAFAPCGLATEDDPGPNRVLDRVPDLLQRMSRMTATIPTQISDNQDDVAAVLARDLVSAGRATIAAAATLLQAARALAEDVPALVRTCLVAPVSILHQIERLDWVLDGWEHICLLWQIAARPSYQRSLLFEMAQHVPELPPQVWAWTGQPIGDLAPPCRVVSMDDAWRSGSAGIALVARNERLRALSV